MAHEEAFFDFAAEVGLTKHLGGVKATDEIAEICQIGKDDTVLDVGCGAGVTPVYLAKSRGCRVVGVDVVPRMIERSRERAQREGVADRTEFRVADAQDLPFDDAQFDAVVTESVTAFVEDKQGAVNEYTRVARIGGSVALNESTWLRTPPPADVVAWASREVGTHVSPLTREEWEELLIHAGLTDIRVRIQDIDATAEAKGILQRYGRLGMVRVFARMLRLYVRNPTYRRFVQGVRQDGIVPDKLDQYFGYGLYVGTA